MNTAKQLWHFLSAIVGIFDSKSFLCDSQSMYLESTDQARIDCTVQTVYNKFLNQIV